MSLYSEEGVLDSDYDGAPDALENLVYGTDPLAWSSNGSRIPDGWLVRHGLDPLQPAVELQPAASPPPESLPDAYGGAWPLEYMQTVWDVYSYERPEEWDEPRQGPYMGGLDPRRWDASGDGIPDGYLLHWELDPRDPDLANRRLAGPDGLTVREAFLHRTDPRSVDTDGDGIRDREEIVGPENALGSSPPRFPPSDPRRFSSSGTGVCDGYLVAFGLDPSRTDSALRDHDRDGATTLQEYNASREGLGVDAACRGEGLDPTKFSTIAATIPDGWLLRHGLDPLDASVEARATQSSETDPQPESFAGEIPADAAPHVVLTVLDEYRFGLPSDWVGPRDGPWWGGTDPTRPDTDGDGLGDAWEQRGYSVRVASDPLQRESVEYDTSSDPVKADTDGDGMTDWDEISGTWIMDARLRDTDYDGLSDQEESELGLGLDPTAADSAGDLLRDGHRLHYLVGRADRYEDSLTYEFPGPPGKARSVTDWVQNLTAAAGQPQPLDTGAFLPWFRPQGDADADGIVNILDPDMDNDGLLNGWELLPGLFLHSPYAELFADEERPAIDMLNPDTDGDGLLDDWEIQFARARAQGRVSLDPALWDSDGDAVPDASEDPDGDSIQWFTFEPVGRTFSAQPPNLFSFNNAEEQTHNTDPNDPDTDGDGLVDGWETFWGFIYPNLAAHGISPGAVHPGSPGPFVVPSDAPRPNPLVAQEDSSVERSYVRSLPDPSLHLPNETLVTSVPVRDAAGSESTSLRYEGTVSFGWKEIQGAETNPYMVQHPLSTDGDGIPDWWEWLHTGPLQVTDALRAAIPACVVGPLLDPTADDASSDPEDDGLTNLEEFNLGSHPMCPDSDLGGVEDQVEVGFGRDPSDAADDRFILERETDSDGDGLFDFEEISGEGRMRELYAQLGSSARIRTNPFNPDSDGDGLLDGAGVPDPSVKPEGLRADSPDPGDAALLRRLLDLGIAYVTGNDGEGFFFLGEADIPSDPRRWDDSGSGIPSGWLVARNLPLSSDSRQYVDHYRTARPDWWQEEAHGVWWGGADPARFPFASDLASLQTDDFDQDGLLDGDGSRRSEDPFPASNTNNALRPIDFSLHGLEKPPADASPSNLSLEPMTGRLLAQAYLNPVVVGPRFMERDWDASDTTLRTRPCIETDPLPSSVVVKGVPFIVSGHLTAEESNGGCVGETLQGITIEARLGESLDLFGAGFTDADGRFEFQVNISKQHTVTIPAGDHVLLGQTRGEVSWISDPRDVRVGPDRSLLVKSYATPTSPGFSDSLPPLQRSLKAVPGITVQAGSVLSLEVPSAAQTGKPLEVRFRLTDSSGVPLDHPVSISLGALAADATPDKDDGTGSITFVPPHTLSGPQTVVGVSSPPKGMAQHVSAARSTQEIILRTPTVLEIDSAPQHVDAGSALEVSGHLHGPRGGVEDALVDMALERPGGATGPTQRIRTGTDGEFRWRVVIDADSPPGIHTLRATAPETDAFTLAEDKQQVQVRGSVHYIESAADPIQYQMSPSVSGRLIDVTAAPVADAQVNVSLGDTARVATTDSQGRFRADFPPANTTKPMLQVLRFDGTPEHLPLQHVRVRPVFSTSHLEVQGGTAGRGEGIQASIRLLDASDRPVSGAVLLVRWAEGADSRLTTDSKGHATYARVGSSGDELGFHTLRVEFPGSPDGTLQASRASATWNIIARTEFVAPDVYIHAGDPIPLGILRETGTQEPLPFRTVRITDSNDVDDAREVTTDPDGRFPLLPDNPRTKEPVLHDLHLQFDGDDEFEPVQAHTKVAVRAATHIDAIVPHVAAAGGSFVLDATVVDAGGRPVTEGNVTVILGDGQVAVGEVLEGKSRLFVDVPTDMDPGKQRVALEYHETERYDSARHEAHTRIVQQAKIQVEADAAVPGDPVEVVGRLVSGGNPVPNETVHLLVLGETMGFEGQTDADGYARFQLTQPNGTLQFVLRYSGSEASSAATLFSSVEAVEPAPPADKGLKNILLLAGLTLTCGVVAVVWWSLRRHPLEPAIRRGLRLLEGRNAVETHILLAYQSIEDVAIALRLLSRPAQTPGVLAEAWIRHIPAAVHEEVRRLVEMFEIARYGAGVANESHRDTARVCLRRILDSLPSSRPKGFGQNDLPLLQGRSGQ